MAGLLGAACCPTVIDRPGEQIAAAPANPPPDAPPDPLDSLEAAVGGRLGVIAMDSADGAVLLARRPDERFAMCSSFKWALAAAVLARVDRGELALAEPVPYAEADLLQHSPVTREHLAEGAMSLEALAEAAVVTSDNAAANLLLAKIGGPAGLTAFLRAEGDDTTRLDRTEPTLNENTPGAPRDTTTPRAMATSLSRLLLGPSLSEASRAR
ncbi:MAG: class A beta-lactamase, partial [Myxococcales bacterium]|nr:class A beta-lactamase [Myxococcales bacterium]